MTAGMGKMGRLFMNTFPQVSVDGFNSLSLEVVMRITPTVRR